MRKSGSTASVPADAAHLPLILRYTWSAVGVRELKEKASSLVGSGHFERAEVLLRQALLLAPRDPQTWLKHAEVLRRLSRHRASASSYRLAARILDDEGHHARSIAALKLALTLLPDDVDIITDIIRSEMKARQTTDGVRSMFPVSSPSQLLSSVHSSESGLFTSSSSSVLKEPEPQLALPMAPHEAPPTPPTPPAQPRTRAAEAGNDTWVPADDAPTPVRGREARTRAAEAGNDTWLPEPDAHVAPGDPARARKDGWRTEPVAPMDGPRPAPVAADGVRAPDATPPADPGDLPPRDAIPPPRGSAPVRFEVESEARWPQVLRLSDSRVAIRAAPGARWVVVEATTSLTVRFEDVLDVPEDAAWLE